MSYGPGVFYRQFHHCYPNTRKSPSPCLRIRICRYRTSPSRARHKCDHVRNKAHGALRSSSTTVSDSQYKDHPPRHNRTRLMEGILRVITLRYSNMGILRITGVYYGNVYSMLSFGITSTEGYNNIKNRNLKKTKSDATPLLAFETALFPEFGAGLSTEALSTDLFSSNRASLSTAVEITERKNGKRHLQRTAGDLRGRDERHGKSKLTQQFSWNAPDQTFEERKEEHDQAGWSRFRR
ncbi:hypothetical protein K435DRAFT_835944 [Dendrothele bispora CBS 962.96]|uniref:Uncharacterized protein n=1 Tax=Dendrothele bispora (strain CBS 962.96) TaxID=1314807 RepID=A0A4S8MKP5_DENBC|nr:hypothetical protein K435DRAFT_835944 [Dendrothele bispora CBS 962.96]